MFTENSLMSVLHTNGFWYNFLCHRKMGIFELSQNLRQFKLSLIVEEEKEGNKNFYSPFCKVVSAHNVRRSPYFG